MTFDPFAGGALVKGDHDTLVANLAGYAADACIHPSRICTPLANQCSPPEVEYIRQFNRHRAEGVIHGLCYVGASVVESDEHMSALAGALVRNFIRARVLTVGTVLDLLTAGNDPSVTCLLIPNFFVSKMNGGGVAPWQIPALLDLLLARQRDGLQTIIYASELTQLDKEYGLAFGRLVGNNFKIVTL